MLDTLQSPQPTVIDRPEEPVRPPSTEEDVAWPDTVDLFNAVQVSGLPEIAVDADVDAWKYLMFSLKLRDRDAFDKAFDDLTPKQQGQFDAFEAYENAWIKTTVPEAAKLLDAPQASESAAASQEQDSSMPIQNPSAASQKPEAQPEAAPKPRGRLGRLGESLLKAVHPSSREQQFKGPDYVGQNTKLLREASPAADRLRPYYEYALTQFPELARTKLIRGKDGSMPYSTQALKGEAHSVTLAMGEDAAEALRDTMQKHPKFIEHVAEMLGVQPEALLADKELLYQFAFLHELGHTVHYQQFDASPDDLLRMKRDEWDRLPVPNVWSSDLRKHIEDPKSDINQWIDANWQRLSQRYGVSTKQELLAVQEGAQRKISLERIADNFATTVLHRMHQAGLRRLPTPYSLNK